MVVTEQSHENGYEDSVGFTGEAHVVCKSKCYVVLEDTCLNQDRYSNNDECEVTRLAVKHGQFYKKMKIKYLNSTLCLYVRKKRRN